MARPIFVMAFFATFSCSYAALKIEDLSYTYDNSTLYWPTVRADRFHFYKKIVSGSGPTYYSMNMFCTAEHGGTHLDAPIHFAEGKRTVEQIPLSHLIGNVVVIDASKSSSANRDYLIGESDFLAYEKAHGRIPDQSIILLKSGKK